MDPKCQILSHILKNHLHGIFSTLVHFEFCLSLMSKWPYRWPFLMTPDDHISLTTNLHWVHNYKSSNQIATNNSDKSIYPLLFWHIRSWILTTPIFSKVKLEPKLKEILVFEYKWKKTINAAIIIWKLERVNLYIMKICVCNIIFGKKIIKKEKPVAKMHNFFIHLSFSLLLPTIIKSKCLTKIWYMIYNKKNRGNSKNNPHKPHTSTERNLIFVF